ncbi:MAG: hypothetical protein ICV83_00595 [Cytophagales bacterium]|nr:hypothetical protein [Cytophagales bacterium]
MAARNGLYVLIEVKAYICIIVANISLVHSLSIPGAVFSPGSLKFLDHTLQGKAHHPIRLAAGQLLQRYGLRKVLQAGWRLESYYVTHLMIRFLVVHFHKVVVQGVQRNPAILLWLV